MCLQLIYLMVVVVCVLQRAPASLSGLCFCPGVAESAWVEDVEGEGVCVCVCE